ncbi:MAG TPA: YceI family protein [Methylovirgula sp.]|nr:YceI family protein [Methylovirgula sp.]
MMNLLRNFALGLAVSSTLAASCVGAAAQMTVSVNKDPSAVQSGNYGVEPVHTRILFAVSHLGFTTWYGNFTHASGSLTLNPRDLKTCKFDITLPIASVTTTNAKLDGELKSADWLDAAKFPTAHFVSTEVVATGPASADVSGNLTLHGVTKPLTLHVTFNGSGVNPLDKQYTAGFNARGMIHRSDFGVSKYIPLVGDDVELIISAAFERQAL